MNTNYILNHLIYLTDSFYDAQTKTKIPFINIYSKFEGGQYKPVVADGEGISCVDDVARAIILAFANYMNFLTIVRPKRTHSAY